MGRTIFSFKYVATVLLTVGLLILGFLNAQQKRRYIPPDDGASWIQTAAGVQARLVVPGGPADKAGIHQDDILKAINGLTLRNDRHVTQMLYELGVWSRATYTIVRNGQEIPTTVVIGPPPEQYLRHQQYLEIIGLVYFLIGVFVLFKRSRAPHALHFYFVCLISFVTYAFHATGKFNPFDWTIFWLDLAASLLLPPLFLHFCLDFPLENKWVKDRPLFLYLLYVPATIVFLAQIAFINGVIAFSPSPILLRDLLDNIGDFLFGAYFVASALVLIQTYRTVRTPELRQQMKWVTRGTAIAVIPYFVLQSIPRLSGALPEMYVDFAIFPLILIPISFGYAIHRYRLMDVDIIFKRGVTYTLATACVIVLYATVVVVVGELAAGFEPLSTVARIVATIVAALLFAPIKDQFQIWLDKFFYRERYDVRQTIIDFGRTLSSEIDLDHMLDRIVDRLERALFVDRAAIFLEHPYDPSRFVPTRITGLTIPENADFSFLKSSTDRRYFFFETDLYNLNYFIPCRVKDRVIAYIALGRTQNGDYLTTEDLDLLETVSGYVGIAIENARLYRSLEQKAAEYQSLKDFSENIIESINVGVMVEDVDGRIVGWNRALARLTGRSHRDTYGRRTSDVIPLQFLQRLMEHGQLYKQPWNGLIVNFSATALVDKAGATRGALIIIDDITDRIRLEDQLVQNDKLTSIGLLAAGVAHEVNTPLAVISSYSQMLRKEISPEDSHRHKLLEKITKQTFRASEIVNNLLNFSRTSATEFVEVDIHQIINDTVSLLEHQFRTARILVARELLADCPTTFGNAGKLQQVFLNLFVNARDAMPEGGELRIRSEAADSKIEIIVSDTGTGISGEHIKKIYDPFFTTKAAGKGTGLGLSVSYGIIQEHGGNISVESRPGVGTSFKLELPLVRKPVNV